MREFRRGLALPLGCLLLAALGASRVQAGAQAVAPGFTCATYASLPFPVGLDFDAAGNLFAGNEETRQGASVIKIRRIAPGGGPVVDYGANDLADPDGVFVDRDGAISGTAGAVVVCGGNGDGTAQIVAVLPDQSVVTLQATTSVLSNPNYMARGRDGLLISDSEKVAILEFVPPGPPVPLISSPAIPVHIAVDASQRIFVAHSDGVIRVYDADGLLLDGSYATGLGSGPPIAFGRGGAFGTDLFTINLNTGELVRVASDKTVAVVGSGFPTSVGGITFGPDAALYVASFQAGEVLRVAPVPPPAIESFFLPKTVKAKRNAADAAKSTLRSVGILDTGPGAANLASAATLDVGGLSFDIPALAPQGRSFVFSGAGATFSVTPNPYGSSRAKFKLNFTGDLTGKVALDGPLTLHFDNASADGGCSVNLAGGVFGLGKVKGALVEPNLFIQRARASLKGPGKDALSVIVGLATGGATPSAASEFTFRFGEALSVTIPAAQFTRKGTTDVFSGNVSGITKVTVDYAREQIAIAGKGLDLGNFAQGGNPVLLSVGLGADARAVRVRMGRAGATMKY